MSTAIDIVNESHAAEAFSRQSAVFDNIYGHDGIITYKRWRVRSHVEQYLQPGSRILELNAGTGEDAIYFAQQGYHVHATDIAGGMQQVLANKSASLRQQISHEICSFTQLEDLKNKGPFDHIFSNFGGLNCTGELDKVLSSFDSLLKPGGKVTMVIISKFCLWETFLVFKGKFRTAFRRFFSKRGRKAHVEGAYFKCFYYRPSYVVNQLKDQFKLLSIEGLCTIVPPSYIDGFAEKYPKTFRLLSQAENKRKTAWPWKFIGDYYIISLEKK